MSPKESKNNIDIIIPVYNEAGVVEHTYGKVCDVIRQLPHIFHIYLVDDGSIPLKPWLVRMTASLF